MVYIYVRLCRRDGSRWFIRWTERIGEGNEYLDELKNSINLPVHSRSCDIRRALSWRYASCGRKDMLILCGAFITRVRPGVFYFHEVLRPVNTFDRKKVEEIFLNSRPGHALLNNSRIPLKRLLPTHNQLLKHLLLGRCDQCPTRVDFGMSLCAKSLKSSGC